MTMNRMIFLLIDNKFNNKNIINNNKINIKINYNTNSNNFQDQKRNNLQI